VQGELYGVQCGLVAVEHHELRRTEPVELAAQLGPDGAAGPGDEYPLAGEVPRDRLDVGLELASPEGVARG
jgi:hypothetical protein